MDGIVYVAHGSQKTGKNDKMRRFYQALKNQRHETHQELAFLEKHPDSLIVVAERLVQSGVQRLVVVPLLLFSAMHKEEDIPEQLTELQASYPQLEVLITPTFAQEPEVLEVLVANLSKIIDKTKLPVTTPVLLVAHGSSNYPKPAKLVGEIGQNLSRKSQHPVATGVLYGQVDYRQGARELLIVGSAVVVLPLFLFDGFLFDKIKTVLGELSQEFADSKQLYYGETLNLDHALINGIDRLIDQTLIEG